MTRVASFAQSEFMLASTLQRQADLADAQSQVTTGKKSRTYAGYSPRVSALTAARTAQSTANDYVRINKQLSTRLGVTDQQVGRLLDAANSIKSAVQAALANNQAPGFAVGLDADLKIAVASLNTQFDGQYLFAGARGSKPPVTVTKLSDLLPLASGQAAFQNDTGKSSIQVVDGVDITFGQLADELGAPLLDSLRRLAQLNNATPLVGQLTAGQQAGMQAELASLTAAISAIQEQQSQLGINSAQVEKYTTSAQIRADDLAVFVSDIEDVNVAEAITRMNRDTTAVQASYKVTADLSRLSLLNYL
jgi:flagellar hook-associated protein 3 FlgL